MLNLYDLVLHTEDLLHNSQIGIMQHISRQLGEVSVGDQKYELLLELKRSERIPPLNDNVLDEQRLAQCTYALLKALQVVAPPLCKYVQKFTWLEPRTGICCSYVLYISLAEAEQWSLY